MARPAGCTEPVLFTWSGGKDSAIALYELQRTKGFRVAALLTTVTEDYGRVSMHGVCNALLERQAEALGLPLEKVHITKDSSNAEYDARMADKLSYYRSQGVSAVAFGDIFLEDVRRYREENLGKVGMKALFPIWQRDTAELARAFLGLGFRAVVTCVDSTLLGRRFAGREFDASFLAELPAGVDPCGERGEFHSFVYGGPIFRNTVAHNRGQVVLRDGFYYCDLLPA
jgi:uncharacterized protein (TIGR00290 family)